MTNKKRFLWRKSLARLLLIFKRGGVTILIYVILADYIQFGTSYKDASAFLLSELRYFGHTGGPGSLKLDGSAEKGRARSSQAKNSRRLFQLLAVYIFTLLFEHQISLT
jgi:hypothetical protein